MPLHLIFWGQDVPQLYVRVFLKLEGFLTQYNTLYQADTQHD
jgi:hypothetical protein